MVRRAYGEARVQAGPEGWRGGIAHSRPTTPPDASTSASNSDDSPRTEYGDKDRSSTTTAMMPPPSADQPADAPDEDPEDVVR